MDRVPLLTEDLKNINGKQNKNYETIPEWRTFVTPEIEANSMKSTVGKQSSTVTIFAVWNTIMGSSLLTMAWGVERAGLPAALILVILMGGLCLYTAYILLRVRAHHGGEGCEVPELCRLLLGRTAECVAHGFSLLVMLGATIVYWILMTNFLYFTVNYLLDARSNTTILRNSSLLCPKDSVLIPSDSDVTHESSYWSLHTTVPLYIAIIIYPLLCSTNPSFFTRFNSLGTLSVVYLLIFILVKGISWGINLRSWLDEMRLTDNIAVLSGMLALSYYIHNIIITIMTNNKIQENNGRDLTLAFVLVTLTYIFVGIVFYICFPLAKNCIEDNLLNNFEMHDTMTAIARALLLFQVITVYPLIVYLFRTQLMDIFNMCRSNKCYVALLNCIIVVICILFACFCPNIGTIIRYTGAISGMVHIFTLPSLLQVRSLYIRNKLTIIKSIFYFSIFLFGAINLLAQFFIA